MSKTVIIEPRFCGPPESGNGGYVCGIISNHADFLAEVSLRKPPPLNKSLTIIDLDEKIQLLDGDILIAESIPGNLHIDVPVAPDFETAKRASKNFIAADTHVFPTCFVCGPKRGSDALRIFAGKVKDKNLVAAPWIPDASLVDENGNVRKEFHWAALDCPGYFAIADTPRKSVLGKMTAQIYHQVKPGDKCVVIGWPIKHDGRKHIAGTAIYTENGALCASAQAVWIDLKD